MSPDVAGYAFELTWAPRGPRTPTGKKKTKDAKGTREPECFRTGVVAESYDEGPEEWDAEEPLEEPAS